MKRETRQLQVNTASLDCSLSIYLYKRGFLERGVLYFLHKRAQRGFVVPICVNFHFTRECNYSCGFCLHTSLTSHKEPIDKIKIGLQALKNAGMRKINFAGGEPFIEPKLLGQMVEFCKSELGLGVSIISNGSKIKRKWLQDYGKYVDVLGISIDSFNEETNIQIGRGKGKHVENVYAVKNLCEEFSIKFKLNTVVNKYNFSEDMSAHISALNPFRWKVFQVLPIEGENTGINGTNRDVTSFLISDEEYQHFLTTHESQKERLVPENNSTMRNSYLILDEYMRFLNCVNGRKEPSRSILEVGVEKALQQCGFDDEMFHKRGGVYNWSKNSINLNFNNNLNPNGDQTCGPSSCNPNPKLDW